MIKRKSYLLLFFVGLALLVFSFISQTAETLVINIHDTYYVVSNIHLYQFYSILVLLLGALYLIFDRMKIQLNTNLSLLHVYGTLVLFLLLIYFNYQNLLEYQPKEMEYIVDSTDYNLYLIETLLAIIFLQILFIINIFVALLKHIRVFVAKNRLLK